MRHLWYSSRELFIDDEIKGSLTNLLINFKESSHLNRIRRNTHKSLKKEKYINHHHCKEWGSPRALALTASAARLLRRQAAASPAVPRAVESDVALDLRLRSRRAHVREEELGGVVLEGLAASQQDAQDHQGVA